MRYCICDWLPRHYEGMKLCCSGADHFFLHYLSAYRSQLPRAGVGYGWVDYLRDIADKEVSDQMFATAANRFPYNTPTTKEGYRYRMIFEELFPGEAAIKTVPGGKSIACSTERAMAWDETFAQRADPSGRAAGVHDAAYDAHFEADDKVTEGEPPAKKAKA